MDKRLLSWIGLLLTLLACNLGTSAPTPTSNLFATLSASTPLSVNPAATIDPAQTATSVFLSTPIPPTITVPTSSSTDQAKGKDRLHLSAIQSASQQSDLHHQRRWDRLSPPDNGRYQTTLLSFFISRWNECGLCRFSSSEHLRNI